MLGPIAYLDPGTGSLFLQILLGGVAGFFVFMKLFWQRIRGMFGSQKNETEPDLDAELEAKLEGSPSDES